MYYYRINSIAKVFCDFGISLLDESFMKTVYIDCYDIILLFEVINNQNDNISILKYTLKSSHMKQDTCK